MQDGARPRQRKKSSHMKPDINDAEFDWARIIVNHVRLLNENPAFSESIVQARARKKSAPRITAHPEKLRATAVNGVAILYGNDKLVVAAREKLMAAQEGKCAICSSDQLKLVIDHDHVSLEIRGLLCRPCNCAVGRFEANLEKNPQECVVAYVQNPPARRFLRSQ